MDASGIDYDRYLKCPDCSRVELYCKEHKAEVEEILGMNAAQYK